MEKFGIFNLLSALSSLAGEQAAAEPEKREGGREEKPDPQPAQSAAGAGGFTPRGRKARAAEMLERHEKIARRIGRKQ